MCFSGVQESLWGIQESFPQISAGEGALRGVDQDPETSRGLSRSSLRCFLWNLKCLVGHLWSTQHVFLSFSKLEHFRCWNYFIHFRVHVFSWSLYCWTSCVTFQGSAYHRFSLREFEMIASPIPFDFWTPCTNGNTSCLIYGSSDALQIRWTKQVPDQPQRTVTLTYFPSNLVLFIHLHPVEVATPSQL